MDPSKPHVILVSKDTTTVEYFKKILVDQILINVLPSLSLIDRRSPATIIVDEFAKDPLSKLHAQGHEIIMLSDCTPSSLISKICPDYVGKYITHIIAWDKKDAMTEKMLKYFLLNKIQTENFNHRFLANKKSMHSIAIQPFEDRQVPLKVFDAFCRDQKISQNNHKHARSVAEELLMNALIDAPNAAKNTPPKPIQFEFSFEDNHILISVTDFYGSFDEKKFWQYVEKIKNRAEAKPLLDSKAEGAGLGILKILHNSCALLAIVEPGVTTQVKSIINLDRKISSFLKSPRTISFKKVHKAA